MPMGPLAGLWRLVTAAPPRGALPHRRRLLRTVVLGWGLAIAIAAAVAGHSASELLAAEVPVVCGIWLAHSGRAGGRIGAVALSLALVAVATTSALIVDDDAVAVGIFAAALVLACWLEDRLAALAAGLAVIAAQLTVAPLTLGSTTSGTSAVLILTGVLLSAVGPWRYNADREQELVRDRESLSQLVEVSRGVAASDDPRGAVVAGLLEFAGADVASLCELTDDGSALEVTSSTLRTVVGARFPTSGEASGVAEAFRSEHSLFIDDTRSHPLIQQDLVALTGIQSILYEPVFVDGRAAGVLTIGWRSRVDAVNAHRRSLLTLAAAEAANAMRRHSVIADLHTQATTDPLTGASNRRAFDRHLAAALRRAGEDGRSVALVMLDLNGFKALNDQQGHAAGDRVLQRCVELWQAELDEGDVLARLGGDEFAAVLVGQDLDRATSLAARLRDAVVAAGEVGTGTGVAVWDGTESARQLAARADQLLYADKAAGTRPPARVDDELARSTGLLDLPTDPELQRLVDTVRRSLGTPLAMVSVVTDETQHVVAQSTAPGVDRSPSSFDTRDSLCAIPTASGRLLAFEDGSLTPALAEHPAASQHGVRSYAGAPIVVDGRVFGTVCGIDVEPRTWTGEQLAALRMAADLTASYLHAHTSVGGRGSRLPD